MGAITRAAANNITTGGIILPAGINDASVASISALSGVNTSDGITLISSQTGSGASQINFTTGIDSTYRTYMFKFINLHPSADAATIGFNGSINGGTNYNVTKTTTYFRARHFENGTSGQLDYLASYDLAQSGSYSLLGLAVGSDNDQSFSGTLYLFSPSSNTYVKHFIATTTEATDDDQMRCNHVAGYFNTTSAINAVSFEMVNIDAGTIHMYGIA